MSGNLSPEIFAGPKIVTTPLYNVTFPQNSPFFHARTHKEQTTTINS